MLLSVENFDAHTYSFRLTSAMECAVQNDTRCQIYNVFVVIWPFSNYFESTDKWRERNIATTAGGPHLLRVWAEGKCNLVGTHSHAYSVHVCEMVLCSKRRNERWNATFDRLQSAGKASHLKLFGFSMTSETGRVPLLHMQTSMEKRNCFKVDPAVLIDQNEAQKLIGLVHWEKNCVLCIRLLFESAMRRIR